MIKYLSAFLTLFFFISCDEPLRQNKDPDRRGMIDGFVFDSITKEPLSNVLIVVRNSHLSGTTDSTGYFKIDSLYRMLYRVDAILNNFYQDSVQIDLREYYYSQVNFNISRNGLYLYSDSSSYFLDKNSILVNMNLFNNSAYPVYYWRWCDVMFETLRYVDQNWESYSAIICNTLLAPTLEDIQPKEIVRFQVAFDSIGTYYVNSKYRLFLSDVDRVISSNIIEIEQ